MDLKLLVLALVQRLPGPIGKHELTVYTRHILHRKLYRPTVKWEKATS